MGADSRDVDIIIGGCYLMMILDYKGESRFKNLGKSDYVICGRSLCKSQQQTDLMSA